MQMKGKNNRYELNNSQSVSDKRSDLSNNLELVPSLPGDLNRFQEDLRF